MKISRIFIIRFAHFIAMFSSVLGKSANSMTTLTLSTPRIFYTSLYGERLKSFNKGERKMKMIRYAIGGIAVGAVVGFYFGIWAVSNVIGSAIYQYLGDKKTEEFTNAVKK